MATPIFGLDQQSPDIVATILESLPADQVVQFCTSVNQSVRFSCHYAIKKILQKYNLGRLPNKNQTLLQQYIMSVAIYESDQLAASLVNSFYTCIQAIKKNNPTLYQKYVYYNDIAQLEYYVCLYGRQNFLNQDNNPLCYFDLPTWSPNLAIGKFKYVSYLSPRLIQNVAAFGKNIVPTDLYNIFAKLATIPFYNIKKRDIVELKNYSSLALARDQLRHAYAVDDKNYITDSKIINVEHVTNDKFIDYVSRQLQSSSGNFDLIFELWKWNRWDLWYTLLEQLKLSFPGSIVAIIKSQFPLDNIDTSEWMSVYTLGRFNKIFPNSLKYNSRKLTSQGDNYHYFRWAKEQLILPKLSINITDTSILQILNNAAFADKIRNKTLIVKPTNSLMDVLGQIDYTKSKLALPDQYFIYNTNIGKLYQMYQQQFGTYSIRLVSDTIMKQPTSLKVAKLYNNYDGLSDLIGKKTSNKQLELIAEFNSLENITPASDLPAKFKPLLARRFMKLIPTLYPSMIPTVDYHYIIRGLTPSNLKSIVPKLDQNALAMTLPFILAYSHEFNSTSSLKWFVSYLKQRPPKLNIEYFVIYYRSLDTLGLSVLLKLYGPVATKNLLVRLTNEDLLPAHVKALIKTYL